ncbi:MAG: DUF2516 family protein [Streptosporangiales bacterium]
MAFYGWFWPLELLGLLFSFIVIIVEVVAFIDAAIRPSKAYEAVSKQSKAFWLIILGIAVAATLVLGGGTGAFSIFGVIGLIAALVYILDVRPAVREVGRGGSW